MGLDHILTCMQQCPAPTSFQPGSEFNGHPLGLAVVSLTPDFQGGGSKHMFCEDTVRSWKNITARKRDSLLLCIMNVGKLQAVQDRYESRNDNVGL